MKAVVLGASGFLGLNLVHTLLAHGIDPICPYRGRAPRMALRRTGATMVPGDFDDPASLVEAMRDADVVFHCGGHYPALSTDRDATMKLGLGQLQNVLDAAAEAKVQRLIFMSSVASVRAADGLSTEDHTFDAPPGVGVYHDLKWLMEQAILQEERFETCILSPGACLGPWDQRIGTCLMLVATARHMAVPHPDGWVNIADSRDVAEIALRVARLDEMPPRLLVSGSNHRLHDLLQALARRYGAPAPPAPMSADEAVALADAEEHRAEQTGERPSISREIVDLTINGSPIDASLATRLTGYEYRTLEETLDAFDEWARKAKIIPALDSPIAQDFQ